MVTTNIYFDEVNHKYYDDDNVPYTSVTTLIHKYVPAFDTKYWSKFVAQRDNKSQKQVEKEWKDITNSSCEKGSKEHLVLEQAVKTSSKFIAAVNYNSNNLPRVFSINDVIFNIENNIDVGTLDIQSFVECFKDNNSYNEIIEHLTYYSNKGYKIYSEVNVYDYENKISGTIDILLVNSNYEFIIIDWKTGRKPIIFESGYFKKDSDGLLTNYFIKKNSVLNFPINNISNCNGMIYTLQLSIYASMLEKLGFTKRGLILFHIKDVYKLNKYGQPITKKDGSYILDGDGTIKIINRHIITYLSASCNILFDHYRENNKIDLKLFN